MSTQQQDLPEVRAIGNRTFSWFTPRGRRPTEYELYTVGQYSSPDEWLRFGWLVRFDDGREPYIEAWLIERRMPSLRGYDAYICGPPPMVEAAITLTRKLGVRDPNIYYDAFVATGTAAL